jgi:hypothetical protein
MLTRDPTEERFMTHNPSAADILNDQHPIQPLYAALEALSSLASHLSNETHGARSLRQDSTERIDELLAHWEAVKSILGIEGCGGCVLSST